MRWQELSTPIGGLGVAVDGDGVCRIRFGGAPGEAEAQRSAGAAEQPPRPPEAPPGGTAGEPEPLLDAAADQLDRYFSGVLTEFTLPLSVTGGSDFERSVWRAIAAIPYGQMRTYGEIAADVGDSGAARAVGIACNRNPLPLVVPCHRVVGAGGKLVGFGGGLPRKRFLLELEARVRIERDFA
ncbi:hypothetical protein GCM10023322_41320 [Rugosimonospora acidiphila]|uniref:Methylated-DNA--protein-cysteine methyltransferase n=1 Tax=Rugosimonospora acidiphila TaxID=556531 RepID=A0ABP9S0S3_9ACTN